MKLIPAGLAEPSDWEDGLWEEKPGYPAQEGTWVHPPLDNQVLPEYEYEEGHDKNRSEPAALLYIGASNDCHIRFDDARLPRRLCKVFKEDHDWFIEGMLSDHPIYYGDQKLDPGTRVNLKHNDQFSLRRPPTNLTYKILLDVEDNWYLDEWSERDYPNKYPYKFPHHKTTSPVVPEELTRLAQQTDQMRRRSEEDQVRVADWAAFAQYVKRHYLKYGIECKPWLTANRPIDPKPPSYPPRPYPPWVCEVLAQERQIPGISESRTMPFASCLALSGDWTVAKPMEYQNGQPPKLEDLYVDQPRDGLAIASGGGLADIVASVDPTQSSGGKSRGKGKDRSTAKDDPKTKALKQTFKDWLIGLDESAFLLQYHDSIAGSFDSLEQIVEIYWKDGDLNKAFFDDAGIKKLGHKRIFMKWFRDICATT